MKVLVTGATGRLGSCVCRLLVEQNIDFVAVDRVSSDSADYPVQIVDLSIAETVDHFLEGVDVLVHLANYTNFDSAAAEEVYSTNVCINMQVFSAAARQGCRRIIFASSVQVLDGQLPTMDRMSHPCFLPYLPLDSEMPSIPRNSYGLSKQAGEDMLEYFSETADLTCIAIRFPLLIDSAMLESSIGQGGMPRGNPYDAYTYLPVYSAAEAVICASQADLKGYQCYFVASKDNLEQKTAQEVIAEGLQDVPCKKPVEELDSLVDCSRVEAELGWRQPQSMQESYEAYGSRETAKPY
ncbi:MAG: NAD(P)-dependent oxidoreductase [Opitutales bacterium]|jgi:nucleoside-diphosphate-sugar epimerase|nr:NAD(P)-dependent oxidoreductase [Opitutales bacterium]MDG2168211.1 NAD(P)-dependent oxidoreductase [Opitutales bacterium]